MVTGSVPKLDLDVKANINGSITFFTYLNGFNPFKAMIIKWIINIIATLTYKAIIKSTTPKIAPTPLAAIVFASKATTAYGINLITVIATLVIIL